MGPRLGSFQGYHNRYQRGGEGKLPTALYVAYIAMESISPLYSLPTEVRYSPPWQDLSIIGIAGSSGSGKSSVAMEIVRSLNLPWVVILVMVQLVNCI